MKKLKSFVNQIMVYRAQAEYLGISRLIENILESTGYLEELDQLEDEKAQQKKENLDELVSKAADYEESSNEEEPTLSGFLEEVALVADIDSMDDSANRLTLMTLHEPRGWNFPGFTFAAWKRGFFQLYVHDVRRSHGYGRGETSLLCGNHQSLGSSDPDGGQDENRSWRCAVQSSLPVH